MQLAELALSRAELDGNHGYAPRNLYCDRTHKTTPFSLDELTDADCWNMFRFRREHIRELADLLFDGDSFIRIEHVGPLSTIEAICVVLRHLSYPGRYVDLEYFFPCDETSLCRIFIQVCFTRLHDVQAIAVLNLLSAIL